MHRHCDLSCGAGGLWGGPGSRSWIRISGRLPVNSHEGKAPSLEPLRAGRRGISPAIVALVFDLVGGRGHRSGPCKHGPCIRGPANLAGKRAASADEISRIVGISLLCPLRAAARSRHAELKVSCGGSPQEHCHRASHQRKAERARVFLGAVAAVAWRALGLGDPIVAVTTCPGSTAIVAACSGDRC